MRWTEVTICTTTEGAEAMAQVLFSVGVGGVSIEDPADIGLFQSQSEDWDYIDESLFEDRGTNVYIKGYIGSDHQKKVKAIRKKVALLLSLKGTIGLDFGSGEVSLRSIKDEDWSENWKLFYKPFNIGDRLAITPYWEPYDTPDRAVVKLEPGVVFGTGQHETTYMCLQMAERIVRQDHNVLDIGCGTGILGIAAVAMGAKNAMLIDSSEAAVEAALHNATINNLADRMEIRCGNLANGITGMYDIIFVNIIANAVIALLPDVNRIVDEHGAIIASGIIQERERDVAEAAKQNDLIVEERMQRGEWITLLLRQKS